MKAIINGKVVLPNEIVERTILIEGKKTLP